ncbi:myosin-2 [Melampsora americana]|nr:myosin-2 [Melampsora americana]
MRLIGLKSQNHSSRELNLSRHSNSVEGEGESDQSSHSLNYSYNQHGADEGWLSAEVQDKEIASSGSVKLVFIDANGKERVVTTTTDAVKQSRGADLPPLRNPPLLEATEDLTNLSYLNEPAVLHTIRTRYTTARQIYTYSGIVLVAVNPFIAVPLYSSDIVQAYAGRKKGDLEPHLFAIAEDAYRCMIRDRRDQTVIVSAKYIMRYFATVDDPDRPEKRKASPKGADGSGMTEVEEQILATNPIMEAFGNAKTTRNDNSSRFGKYIEILFDSEQTIVYQPETERNYHIFYQLIAGTPQAERKQLGLDSISKFHYLNQGGASAEKINSVDDKKEFALTQDALSTVGIGMTQQWAIFKLLAALLHLGNIDIKASRTDAAMADDDPSLILASHSKQFCINYTNEKLQAEFNAHVFKLEQEEYIHEKIDWKFIEFSDNQPTIDLIEGKLGILSLLDEESRLPSGSDNSFVQKLYSQLSKPEHSKVFKKPKFGTSAFTIAHYALDVTYEGEGFLEKNKDSVPDEHLNLLFATQNTFLKDILEKALEIRNSPNAAATNTHKSVTINSSAGAETVTSPMSPSSSTISSKRATASSVVPSPRNTAAGPLKRTMGGGGVGGGTTKKPTLGSIFKHSLIALMETIDSTNAHYIRCIKPNEAKRAWEFDPPMVLGQLRACGVLETIKISAAGAGMLAYLEQVRTDRINFLVTLMQKNFMRTYHQMRYKRLKASVVGVQTIWRSIMAKREKERMRKERAIGIIQRQIRCYLGRQKFLKTRTFVIQLQSRARGIKIRSTFVNQKTFISASRLQALFRGHLSRKAYKKEIKKVILIQSIHRKRSARKELLALKQEAKSVVHFKEVSYKLENKVVELTQTLQKRTQENKSLQSKLNELQLQLESWMSKIKSIIDLRFELPEFVALGEEKKKTESQLAESLRKIEEQDKMISNLTIEFERQAKEMEDRQKLLDSMTSNGLNADSTSVSVELLNSQKATRGDHTFHMATGQTSREALGSGLNNGSINGSPGSLAAGKRKLRRHSADDLGGDVLPTVPTTVAGNLLATPNSRFDNPRAVSVAYAQTPNKIHPEIIMRLLEDEEPLDEDVLVGLIKTLKVPTPSLQNPPSSKEVLFPAHLIMNGSWPNVMQTIQQHVMGFQGEEAIIPGIFWLSNVHEVLSFVCIAESDILQGIGPGVDGAGRDFDWDDYERLVTIVKHDLDSLEYNIYHTWMQETKKKLHKMVVPALIESQSLPGFVTNDGGGRLFNRLLSGNHQPAFNMDDILNLLNKVWKSLKRTFVLGNVPMQIQYNITRLEEWCKSRDMPEGTLQLEHLMQATKLLQLKKATIADIDTCYDVCWMLTPSQIQKLILQYHVADYENPIAPEILKAVASRVMPNDKNDHLMLPPEVEEAGPYEVPLPREVMSLDTYCPAWLNVPHIRRLTQVVA